MGRVAYIVSPHGFGHAARACAVMAEVRRQCPAAHFEVFTEVPKWFFSESLPNCFSYHPCASDVGLVQSSPLIEDLEATCDLLDRKRCDDPNTVGELASKLQKPPPALEFPRYWSRTSPGIGSFSTILTGRLDFDATVAE